MKIQKASLIIQAKAGLNYCGTLGYNYTYNTIYICPLLPLKAFKIHQINKNILRPLFAANGLEGSIELVDFDDDDMEDDSDMDFDSDDMESDMDSDDDDMEDGPGELQGAATDGQDQVVAVHERDQDEDHHQDDDHRILADRGHRQQKGQKE